MSPWVGRAKVVGDQWVGVGVDRVTCGGLCVWWGVLEQGKLQRLFWRDQRKQQVGGNVIRHLLALGSREDLHR